MRLVDVIKFGFGFYVGYEIAKNLDDIAGTLYKAFKNRVQNGSC